MPTNAFGDEIASPGSVARNAFGDPLAAATGHVATGRQTQDIADAMIAGWQGSAAGLILRGKLPDRQLAEDAPWYHRLAYGVAGIGSDVASGIAPAGFLAGGMAGGAVAGPVGGIVGGGAGGFAVPMALREGLVAAYNHDQAMSWQGAMDIVLAALKGGGKGALIGGATMGAGAAAARVVGGAIAPSIGTGIGVSTATRAITGAQLGGEIAALTTASAAIEGHMPSAQDFLDNAILLGGMKSAGHIAKGMKGIFAETGKRPEEVLADAQKDPTIKAALESQPVRAYHGTADDIQAWSVQGNGLATGAAGSKEAIFFTNDPTVANNYVFSFADRPTRDAKRAWLAAKETGDQAAIDAAFLNYQKVNAEGMASSYPEGGAVYPVSLRLKNPLVVDFAGKEYFDEGAMTRALEQAKAEGRDGVIFKNAKDDPNRLDHKSDVYAVIDPAAIHNFYEPAPLPPAYRPIAIEERIKAALDSDPRPEYLRRELTGENGPPKFGDPAADPVKYEYIAGREELRGVIRGVAEWYAPEIEAQRRGTISVKESIAEGIRKSLGGEVAEHVIGQAENAETLAARAHVLKGALNNAKIAMDALAGTPGEKVSPELELRALAGIEQVSMVLAELSGAAAEGGRALNILRAIKRDPDFLGEGATLLALAKRANDGHSMQDIAKLIQAYKDPAQLAKFVTEQYKGASNWEKVIEAWKAGTLSGPQTHLSNIMGNLGKFIIEIPESAVSAAFYAIERGAKGDPISMAQFKARAFAPYYGLKFGSLEALKVAAEVWKHGDVVEKGDMFRPAIGGKAGEAVRIPFKLLQVEDALFRVPAERAQAYIMAVDRAAKEGLDLSSREGRELVQKWVEDPAMGLSEKAGAAALEAIKTTGLEAVFAQRIGPRMEAFQRSIAGTPFQFVMPYVRTPTNILSWVVQHTPGLNLMSGRWNADFMAGGERQARAVARLVIGTGLGVTAISLMQDGLLTGGGQFDKEQGGVKRAAGWQPYSIKVGDTWYSYQRLEPVGKLIGLAADLVEMSRSTKDDKDAAKTFTMMALLLGNATVSTTYLSGLSNALNAVTDPDRYGEAFVEQYATSLVPKIIGQTAAMMDSDKREVDGALDAIQSQLPIFREKLLPKRDVWGEPAKNDRWFAVMPVATSEASQDKVRTEAMRLQFAIADVPKFVTEKGPFKPSEKRLEMTGEQRDVLREVRGKNAMAILAPIVNAPDWSQIPDFAKVEIYKKVLAGTTRQGAYSALPPDDISRVKLREEIVNKIIEQTQSAQGQGTLK